MTNRFLRIMINLAVSHSLKHESTSQQPTQLSYLALDGFVRIVILLVNGERLTALLCSPLQADLTNDCETASAPAFPWAPKYIRAFRPCPTHVCRVRRQMGKCESELYQGLFPLL